MQRLSQAHLEWAPSTACDAQGNVTANPVSLMKAVEFELVEVWQAQGEATEQEDGDTEEPDDEHTECPREGLPNMYFSHVCRAHRSFAKTLARHSKQSTQGSSNL